ncbi:hypothetical protein L228DRAFT_238988 [Xylona heveae TC161]|uniref:Uncharacterized protein n=1 Tax=Xylona heveae (strain CBS 132557 / TC161) TaxID=1328760 RepID=A0A165GAQ9_XYLHT|nr:hypothetical protein L228DRAFT_238988 [Xylona heveae TC161]KZF21957.1 hypothetical protein L228DRAFT_238988 [Xylona heveae TC161]
METIYRSDADVRNLFRLYSNFSWLDVQKRLDDEREESDNTRTPWTKALVTAAAKLYIPRKQFLYEIMQYATRNNRIHNEIEKLVDECDWSDEGTQLYFGMAGL